MKEYTKRHIVIWTVGLNLIAFVAVSSDVSAWQAQEIGIRSADTVPKAHHAPSLNELMPDVPLTATPTPSTKLTLTPLATNKLPTVTGREDCMTKPQVTAVPSAVTRPGR